MYIYAHPRTQRHKNSVRLFFPEATEEEVPTKLWRTPSLWDSYLHQSSDDKSEDRVSAFHIALATFSERELSWERQPIATVTWETELHAQLWPLEASKFGAGLTPS